MSNVIIPKFEVEAAPESRLAPFDITVDPSKVREFDQKKFDDWFSDMHKRSKMHYGYDYETAYIAGIEPDEEGNWPEWLKRPGTPSSIGTWSDETSEKKKSKVVIPKFGESVKSGVTDYAGARERGEDILMPSPKEIRKKYEATIKGMEDTKQEIIKAGDFTPELVEKYNTLLAQAKDYEAVYEPEKGRSVIQYLGDAISPGFTERGLEEGARRRAQKEEFRRYREEHGEAHPDEKHKSVRVAKQFVTGALNQALLGLPEAYWQATGEHDEPEGTAEKVAHGFGSAVGFIIGGPGKVAASIGSRILTKAAVHAGSKFGKRVVINLAREIPALTGASLAASTGEMLTSTGIDEALDTLFSATVGGAAMGAAFGATRGIIPGVGAKEFIKRYGLGVTLLDLVRGERPWDDRELGEKVFGYTLDAAFLLHGMPRNRSLQLQLLKSDQKIADLISNKEIREAWKTVTAAEREALLRRFNKLGAESEEVATRAEEVVPRPELPGSRDVLYPGETPTGKWYEQGEQGMIPSKSILFGRAVEEALATELPKLPAADRVYGEGFTARDVRPVDMQQGAVEPEIVRPGAEPEVVRPLPSHSEAGPTEVQARSKIDRPSAKTTREAEISLLKNIKAAGEAGLRERGSISVDLAQKSKGYTKVLLKNSLEDGSVSSGSPVRLTTVDELRAVLKSGSLVVGKDAEGHSVISAQPLRRHLPIVGYGANNKVSAAIVFKPEHVEGKGGQPNEIIIDPKTKLEDLKFAVSGQTKLLNIQELRSLVSYTKPEVKVESKTKLTAEDKGLDKLAKSLNATYDGKMGLPGKEVNLFTDKVTKSTFAFKEGEDISVELPKKRKAFLADAVKANEDNPKAARPHVRKLGRQVYKEGATQWQRWSGEMRKLVGKSFAKLKDLMRKEWEQLRPKTEKSAETIDILTQLREQIDNQKGITRITPDIARTVYNLGAKVYSAGQRVHSTWQKEMRGLLGDLWGKLKHVASVAWKTINNQSGAIKNPFYREDPTIKPLGRLERVKEVGEIFGELWSDSKVSVEKARQTLAGMRRPKPPIPDIGGVEYVPGADARYEDQRVIRKSERTRLIQESGKLRQFLDKVQADIEKFSSPSGEATYNKEIERRVARLEKDITRLMKAGSKQKASRLKKAVEQLNQRSVTRHIGNLKRIQTKLTEAVAAKEAQMAATPDVQDILSAKIERVKVKFLKQMPDMNYAILGRFLENPIYTFEAWGRKVKGGTSAIKEMFVYPLRSAETKAVKQFMVIREKADALKASLPRSSGKRIITYAISQEKGGAAVLKNEGITEIPKLTEKEMEVYNWMRKGFDVFHGLVNKRRLEAGMEPMGFIENYFTFSRELTLADALGFGFMDSAMNKYLHPKGTAFPHALKRKGGIEKIQLDAFNVFNSYMQLATKHMYLSPEIARMREYARTIEFSHPNTYKMLTDYLDFKAGIKHSTLPPGLDNIFRIISDNVTTATLVSNVRSAFVQPAAITNAYAALGEKYTALGISGLFAKVPGTEMTWYEFAREESNHLLNRSFDASYDAIRTGMVGKVARARAKFVKSWAGVRPLQELDALTASATWIGAYRKAVEFEGMRFGSKEARNYADDITIKTQASAAKEDLAPIQRTALGKFFTTFQTFVINNWNFVKREMAGIGNTDVSKPEVARNMARYMFGLMLAGIFYEDVLGVNAPDPTPFHAARDVVERGGTAGEATMAGILEALQILPGISGIRYGTTMLGASAQFLSDTGSALYSSSGGHIARRIPWYELAGKALGIPGTVQASKFIKIREKGGSVVESIIGAYPETAKDKKRAFRKIYKRAIENKDYDKARELRQDVINWNRKKAAEGKYDERIDID